MEIENIVARPLPLKDWWKFDHDFEEFLKESSYDRLGMDRDTVESYYKLSLVDGNCLFAVLEHEPDSKILGFTILHTTPRSEVIGGKFVNYLDAFVRGLYVSPKAHRQASSKLDILVTEWARSLKITRIYGHCRPGFPVEFAKSRGFDCKYIVIERSV